MTAFDSAGGRLAWRPDERFPMCSTFKWLLAAQVLSRVDRRRHQAAGGTAGGLAVGDKTGMGANGATNDVAIIGPARETPVLVAAYLTESAASVDERNGALAAIGSLVAEWVRRTRQIS